VDPHHLDADPDEDPYPTFHPDADPDPDPDPRGSNPRKSAKIGSYSLHFGLTFANWCGSGFLFDADADADPDIQHWWMALKTGLFLAITMQDAADTFAGWLWTCELIFKAAVFPCCISCNLSGYKI
jgi:hypothetical protein